MESITLSRARCNKLRNPKSCKSMSSLKLVDAGIRPRQISSEVQSWIDNVIVPLLSRQILQQLQALQQLQEPKAA
jgi:hypothetical protein